MILQSVVKILITLSLVAIVDWSITQLPNLINPRIEPSPSDSPAFQLSRISSKGEQILVGSEVGACANSLLFDADKRRGAASMAMNDFTGAITHYQQALQKCHHAPETLIYLNNAKIAEELNSNKISSNQIRTIAVSVPITGSDPGKALMMLRGFSQAQTEELYKVEELYSSKIISSGEPVITVNFENIGEKLIQGERVQLQVIDDGDKQDLAAQIAKEILKDDSILAIAGHWSSPVSLEAANEYRTKKTKVFITPISISDGLKDESGYVFRINAVSSEGSKKLVDYIKGILNLKRIVMFYDSTNPYCEELMKKIGSEFKGESEMDSYDLSDDKLDIRSVLTKIKQSSFRPALILIPAAWSINKALQVVAENAKLNYKFPLIGDMSNLYTLTTLQVGDENAIGMVLAPAWNYDRSIKSDNPKFAQHSFALWGEVNFAAALSYNAAEALIQALKISPSSQGIHDQLFKHEKFIVNGASGQFSFQPLGDASTKAELVEICPDKTSGDRNVDFKPIVNSPPC